MEKAREELASFEESRRKYAEASQAKSLGSHGTGAVAASDGWDDWGGGDWSETFATVSIVGDAVKRGAAFAGLS